MQQQDSSDVTIGVVAGEVSGDILGAGLVKALKRRLPDATFIGIAGPMMQAQGVRSLFDMSELSVMGLVEVLKRLRRLLSIRRQTFQYFSQNKPDVFIGIDAPDFNLSLEQKLKNNGIKTIHYVSPSVWAWRQRRVLKVAKATHTVLSLFPFEKAFYDAHDVPCTFVGHTLADQMPIEPDVNSARRTLKVEPQGRVVAILPGSRSSEVAMLLPVFLQAIDLLRITHPELTVLLPVVDRERKVQIEQIIEGLRPRTAVRLIIGHSREVMTAADAILLASGTATLEAMLCKKPMVVAYKFKPSTFWIVNKLLKTPYVSIPNILAQRKLVPELLQDDATPESLSSSLAQALSSNNSELVAKFTELHQQLKLDADERAADAVCHLLQQPHCD